MLGWSVGYELEGERVGKYATGSKEGAPVGASEVGMTVAVAGDEGLTEGDLEKVGNSDGVTEGSLVGR